MDLKVSLPGIQYYFTNLDMNQASILPQLYLDLSGSEYLHMQTYPFLKTQF